MVLTGRRTPRAALLAALAAAAALAGCNQSLFDNHNGVGGGGDGGSGGSDAGTDGPVVPTSCPAGCLGDAATDFDGSDTGHTGVWRYFEDQGRAWMAMAINGSTMNGHLDPANQITTCRSKMDAAACGPLPGALLMSSGADSQVDPAIAFITPVDMPPQVLQLSLRSYLASGADQTIRIYRNSREDLLFRGTLTARNRVEQPLLVDALPGDRFLVAIDGAGAATDVALQFYVSAPGQTFPASCQLALSFNPPASGSTPDPCSQYAFSHLVQGPPPTTAPVVLGAAPYTELGQGAMLSLGGYLQRDGIAPNNALNWKDHDVTVQFWTQPMMLGSTEAYLFSDFDPDTCGGVELSVGAPGGTAHINLAGCIDPDPMKTAQGMIAPTPSFPMDGGWHFIRAVRNAAGFDLCIDGGYVASLPVLPGTIESHNQPDLGKQYSASSAFFAGGFDDVRVFTGALPCK
jgi:hypothetical protein